VSTPTGRPSRPASAFDYAPKWARDQWDSDAATDGPDTEPTQHLPRDLDEDPPAPTRHGKDEGSSLVPQGPHERAEENEWERTDDAPPLGWNDEPDHRVDAHDRQLGSTASDEAQDEQHEQQYQEDEEQYQEDEEQYQEDSEGQHEAHDRDRHLDPYDEHLERLAATLRSLRPEDGAAAPKLPPAPQLRPATRGVHSTDADDRDVYIDGTRLPRFLHANYEPSQGAREGIGFLGPMIAVGIASLFAAPLAYYVAFGNPLASAPRAVQPKPELQYTMTSTSKSLSPLPLERQDAQPANVVAPNAPIAQPAPLPAPQPPSLRPIEPKSQAPASARAPRSVPLTRVVRWPDAAQDSGATEPPRGPSLALAPEQPRPNAAPTPSVPTAPRGQSLALAPEQPRPNAAPAPSAPATTLALAPPAPAAAPQPAPPQLPARNTDEIELMLKQGQDFVAAGDLATARIVLRRAAEAGAAAAALALGQTYDPKVLAKMGVRGVVPDVEEARRWYETAQKLGSGEAARRLEQLARNE